MRSTPNSDIGETLRYHEGTKHSEVSIRASHHPLDWANKPRPFKVYAKISPAPLPLDLPRPRFSALASVSGVGPPNRATGLNIRNLAELLFFSGGLTREMKFPLGSYYMRAAPATGALYPIELYAICANIDGLEAGVYHFGPGDFSLTQLRKGDYRAEVSLAAGRNEEIATSPVTIAMTSLAWRNAWKYQARSYRHWFWDSGAMAANLLATVIAAGLSAKLVVGFDDAKVNLLLGLEEGKEATVALAPVGAGAIELSEARAKPILKLRLETVPLSEKEVQYPEVWRVHASSSLEEREVGEWVRAGLGYHRKASDSKGRAYPLQPYAVEGVKDSLEEVILRRGSTRRFARKSLDFHALSAILQSSSRGVQFDFLGQKESLIEIYLVANAVEGLSPGAYYFEREGNFLEQLKGGSFRASSEYLCLEQPLFSDASVVLFLMADLGAILKQLGNRGYRAAQFEAGVILGRIYLSSYALRLGASGSTFYDDAVTDFFSPHARDMNTMVAVGVGIPDYQAREGKVRVPRLKRSQLMERV